MNKKTVFIALGVGAALLGVLALTMLLIAEPHDTRSRADDSAPPTAPTQPIAEPQQSSCPSPSAVSNVQVEFPNCIGDVCNFTEAACVWDTVTGASQYKLTITEVETSTIVRDDSVEASITRVDFPINQNQTYKCDVAAINSCGAVGVAATHSLLCETDALIEEPTPTPTIPPLVACGSPCAATSECASGLVCAVGAAGQGYCAIPSYQNACIAAPSTSACCTAPTVPPSQPTDTPTPTPVPPTLPPTGILGDTMAVGAGVLLLILLGAALFVL